MHQEGVLSWLEEDRAVAGAVDALEQLLGEVAQSAVKRCLAPVRAESRDLYLEPDTELAKKYLVDALATRLGMKVQRWWDTGGGRDA